MRILVIKSKMPFPPIEGSAIVSFNLLRSLSTQHEIALVSIVRSELEKKQAVKLREYCDFTPVYIPRVKSLGMRVIIKLKEIISFITRGVPQPVEYYCPKRFVNEIERIVKSNRYDLVLVEYWHTARVICSINNVKRAILYHDSSFRTKELLLDIGEKGMMQSFNLLFKNIYKRYELKTANWFDYHLTLSEQDAFEFKREIGAEKTFEVLPVWIDAVDQKTPLVNEDIDLIFVGDMSYCANEDAVIYFICEILPVVRSKIGSIKLHIVGKCPSKKITEYNSRDNIVVTGYVDDINSYLLCAKVVVIPLRIGSGIKVKTLEALSAGKAIVSSTIGIQGINVNQGQDVIVADDPKQFADNIINLMSNKKERESLGANAKNKFINVYSRSVVEPKILQMFNTMRND